MQDTTFDYKKAQLILKFPTAADTQALLGQKAKQQHFYDRHAHDLPPLSARDSVHMQLPGQNKWRAGLCIASLGQRSYGVKVGEYEFRRNRRHLLRTNEQPPELELPIQETEIPATNTPQAEDRDSQPNSPPHLLWRSERVRKPPDWIMSYVPSQVYSNGNNE